MITALNYAPDINNFDQINFTALATNLTLLNPVTTSQDGQKLLIRILDNGVSQGLMLASGAGGYRAVGVLIPASTSAGKEMVIGCIYNAQATVWDVVALVQQQ